MPKHLLGCNEANKDGLVSNRGPQAILTLTPTGNEGTSLVANGSTSFARQGTLRKWRLDFGDGSAPITGTGYPPSSGTPYTYATPGIQATVTLYVEDNKGRMALATTVLDLVAGGDPPVNCVLADPVYVIGDWGPCQPDGTQIRTITWTRAIVTPPANGGTPCGPTSGSSQESQGCTYTPPVGPSRTLLGGWRIAEEFAQGCIAIDFSRMKLWMVGHAQRQEVLEYDLPAMGTGSDVNAWPRVDPISRVQSWWAGGYANGLIYWQNKLWVSPRVFYDTAPPPDMTLYAQDGEQITLPLPRQKFAGFVKRGPGLDPFIGGGGYESGQGTQSGPSLATLAGQILIEYQWPADPGPLDGNGVPENWNLRAPREPNYMPLVGFENLGDTTSVGYPGDYWVGWVPRTINGEMQGRWASDIICGGGLVLPEGITYWPWMGVGNLDYRLQTWGFAEERHNYVYHYDPQTYQFIDYAAQPYFDTHLSISSKTAILGQELGPDGKVYLAHGYQWQSGAYRTDVALKVFGV